MTKRQTKITGPSFFIGQEGGGIISFGSGQPDLPPPKEIFELKPKYSAFKYGLIQGEEKLREALAREYPNASAENFVITNGASEALDLVLRVLAKEPCLPAGRPDQNRVLLCRPYYYSYPFVVKFAGMEPVYTDLKEGRIDLADFRKKSKGVKAVLINSPSNPTGRIEAMETLAAIEKTSREENLWVISDEVYKDLIYERQNYLIKGRRVITLNSFSKTYSMCGLRVGYLYSPDRALVRKAIEMKVHTSMNTNSLAQEMALAAARVNRAYVRKQVQIWKRRRDLIYGGLIKLGFSLWRPEGAFYVLPKIKNSGRAVSELFHKYKVIVYDGAWFGAPDRIRLSYALDEKKIEEGLKRIAKFLKGKEGWL